MATQPEALLLSLPDSGTYEDFKDAVFATIPAHRELARRIIEHDLEDLGATDVRWIQTDRRTADNGKDYWFLLGEGVFEKSGDFNAFHQSVLQLGTKHFGWTPGMNTSFMGDKWVFNFTVAVRAI